MSEPQAETPHIRLPVEIQDLVFAGKLTINAGWLYGLLLRHLNYKRGDAHVWPSRSSLAKRMRFKNARAVDRYLDELANAGLIEKERRRNGEVNDSNRYTLLLVSWPKAPHPEGVVGYSALPPGVLERTTPVSHSAPELDELELERKELKPSLSPGVRSSAPAPSPTGGQERERDGEEFSKPDNPTRSLPKRLVIKHGAPEDLAEDVAGFIEGANQVNGHGWWIVADRNGSLAAQVTEAIAGLSECIPCRGTGQVWSEQYGTMTGCPRCGGEPGASSGRMAAGLEPRDDRQPRSSERRGYVAPKVDVPPGYSRRPDGSLVLTNSRHPDIDWEQSF